MKYVLFFLTFFSAESIAQSLIPIGQWRSHFSYNAARLVTLSGTSIYCSTDNGLFFYDLEDNSLNKITKNDGLSDVSISAIHYSGDSEKLIIGYESGLIDLVDEGSVISISEVKDSEVTGSKRVNYITSQGSLAYLSTEFGVVVVDLAKDAIKESYLNLGPQGERSAIRQSVISDDSLFLATDFGLISGNIDGTDNLVDFLNWDRGNGPPDIAESSIDFVASVSNMLVAGGTINGLYAREGNQWEMIETTTGLRYLSSGNESLFLSFDQELTQLSLGSDERIDITYAEQQQPNTVLVDQNDRLWIADGMNGLFGGTENAFENFRLNGPASNSAFRLFFEEEVLYLLHGGYDENLIQLNEFEGFSQFLNGTWVIQSTEDQDFGNIADVIIDNEEIKLTSFGDGLFDFPDRITDEQSDNSPFADSPENEVLITGIDKDSEGNLWIAKYEDNQPLLRRDPQNNWSKYGFGIPATTVPLDIKINLLDDIWVILDIVEGGGVLVYNDETEESVILTTSENSGSLPSREINDLVFDREGQVWLGTANGVAFIPNPASVFDPEGPFTVRPIFDNRFLFEGETITALAVDGGNRKWIGTESGLWLFDDLGEELIAQYDSDNSPLPSNEILDIEINAVNGEVFIATSKGLVSLRGTSTQSIGTHRDVKIFPNPVKPGFEGFVGISGLAEDAVVKITDIGGRLIKEVRAAGGTATWDARGFNGNRASTGIYLVFSSSPDGDDNFVGKIAVIR